MYVCTILCGFIHKAKVLANVYSHVLVAWGSCNTFAELCSQYREREHGTQSRAHMPTQPYNALSCVGCRVCTNQIAEFSYVTLIAT